MGITVTWDNDEKNICRVHFSDPFTWAGYDESIDKLWEQASSVDHNVDIIATMTPGMAFPRGLPLTHLQRAAQTQPANVGLVVMVNYPALVKAFIRMLARLNVTAAKSGRFAPSVEEAYILLKTEHAADLHPGQIVNR